MNYVILAAGIGSRLHPYTKTFPKSLIKVGEEETAIRRNISIIRELDRYATITLVLGYMMRDIEIDLINLKIDEVIFNPFYKTTNSIASLWLAKKTTQEDSIIINGDVVFERKLLKYLLESKEESWVAYDTSIRDKIDYAVQMTNDGHISVMGKNLENNQGEYVGIIKMSKDSLNDLMQEIEDMLEENFDTWYETALVQMILTKNFKIVGKDVSQYKWTELDSISDIFLARDICARDVR